MVLFEPGSHLSETERNLMTCQWTILTSSKHTLEDKKMFCGNWGVTEKSIDRMMKQLDKRGNFEKDTSKMGAPMAVTPTELAAAAQIICNYQGYITFEQLSDATDIPTTTLWRWISQCFSISYSYRALKPSLDGPQMKAR